MGGRTYFVTLIFLPQFSNRSFISVFKKLRTSQLQSDDKISRKVVKITPTVPCQWSQLRSRKPRRRVLRFKYNQCCTPHIRWWDHNSQRNGFHVDQTKNSTLIPHGVMVGPRYPRPVCQSGSRNHLGQQPKAVTTQYFDVEVSSNFTINFLSQCKWGQNHQGFISSSFWTVLVGVRKREGVS